MSREKQKRMSICAVPAAWCSAPVEREQFLRRAKYFPERREKELKFMRKLKRLIGEINLIWKVYKINKTIENCFFLNKIFLRLSP